MLAAGISESEAQKFLAQVARNSVVVACYNSPSSVTISGNEVVISELEQIISGSGKFSRKLRVAVAYHSPHMVDVAKDCLEAMEYVGLSTPAYTSIPIFSSVTGKEIQHDQLTASYWIRNMCKPVRFCEAMQNLLLHSQTRRRASSASKWSAILELGPHPALKAPLRQIMESIDPNLTTAIPYMSMVSRGEDSALTSVKVAGILWATGHGIDVAAVNQEEVETPDSGLRSLANIPSWPWNHEKGFWHESKSSPSQRFPPSPRLDLLGMRLDNQNAFEHRWRNLLRINENPWINDHKITGTTLYRK